MASFLDIIRTRFPSKPGAAQAKLVSAYREVFSAVQADLVLHDLVVASGFMKTHGGDPFEEGKRALMLYILKMLRTDPEYMQRLADREIAEDE